MGREARGQGRHKLGAAKARLDQQGLAKEKGREDLERVHPALNRKGSVF